MHPNTKVNNSAENLWYIIYITLLLAQYILRTKEFLQYDSY